MHILSNRGGNIDNSLISATPTSNPHCRINNVEHLQAQKACVSVEE